MKVKIFSLLFVFIFYGCEPFINVSTEILSLHSKLKAYIQQMNGLFVWDIQNIATQQ